jgi:ribosomal protein S18 acetylase RimI-like enzyme
MHKTAMTAHAPIPVRPTEPADISALTAIINAIIAIGGTTAYQDPFTEATLGAHLLDDPRLICCHTALDPADGLPAGYQVLKRHPDLPEDWGDIASFARPAPKLPGVGRALFSATSAFARDNGLVAINATIRADNQSGLGYYGRIGFEDYAVARAIPLKDGTPVDRVSKRFML